MILKIQKSRSFKLTSIVLAINIFAELVIPSQAWALTGGPKQPEFNSFTPISTSDMVDLSSGDMSYNIPLMDVGGYPLNIAYNSGVSMDQEASWVGLGWNLSVGQITRNVRGLPDDFRGDVLTYEDHLRKNITAGANFEVTPGIFGGTFELSFGIAAMYNNYNGFTMKPSVGIGVELGDNVSIGFNVQSGPDGLCISPNLSLHSKAHSSESRNRKMGLNLGCSWNSRQGLMNTTLRASASDNHNDKFEHEARMKTNGGAIGVGSSISFSTPTYTPTKRVPMLTRSFTVNASLGGELYGVEAQGQITAYGTETSVADETRTVNAYGYSNTEKANKHSVLDFNREKDGVFSPNSTNLPLTNYTYDTYSVQGQGVSGQYRPFRNQVGYVYDAFVLDESYDGTGGFEVGGGNAVHVGADFDVTHVSSHSGLWGNDNGTNGNGNYMMAYLDEDATNSDPDYESVHFKNVGDLGVDRDFGMFSAHGAYQPSRIDLTGGEFYRKASPTYRTKLSAAEPAIAVTGKIKRHVRQLRNQAIYNLTNTELGLGMGMGPLSYETSPTISSNAKGHHINEVQITRADGARYIYGQPAYNNKKIEATFAVSGPGDCSTGLVYYPPGSLGNPSSLPNDQFLNKITTPGYVHTHLLSSVLSTDYVDKAGDGPTMDDFGSYTKFSYVRKNANYKWRVPYSKNHASYNEGLKTNVKDDQGNYVYGEKEQFYVQKIETKTHVAIFHISERNDGHGVASEHGGIDTTQNVYKLDSISLYSVGEYYSNAALTTVATNPTPIKTVHFEYSYSLCPGVETNDGDSPAGNEKSNLGGKLTLKKIYFTYRDSKMGEYMGYHFNYNEFVGGVDEYDGTRSVSELNYIGNTSATGENPEYNIKGYDTWGNYKPNGGGCGNTAALNSAEFPYTSQDRAEQDIYAAVWTLKTIDLPSGGSISISYESDDYSYVQDKEVNQMFMVRGAGDASDGSSYVSPSQTVSQLYNGTNDMEYLYIEVEEGETSWTQQEIEDAYIPNANDLIQFRFLLNMTKFGGVGGGVASPKFDYVTGYFQYERDSVPKIFVEGSLKYLSLPVKLVDLEGGIIAATKVNPIAKAGWHFGRKYLNDAVYSDIPSTGNTDIESIANEIISPSIFNNIAEIFAGPNGVLQGRQIARQFLCQKSWVRLRKPGGEKLGGGSRVTEIRMSDVWGGSTGEMNDGTTGYETMRYGQTYSYELESGGSSGVATYEPVGNKENPFVQPIYTSIKKLLAPDEENYIERPFGESFFPSPQVTYSRVTVSNVVAAGDAPSAVSKVKRSHRTGKVVTEFYTSKDFPTIVDNTIMEAYQDDQEMLADILSMNVRKHYTASQGYMIHLNDMNGKQKAEWVYAEGQSEYISGVEYKYRTYTSNAGFNASNDPDRNKGLLNNKVKVINPDGTIQMKTIGVEVDVVNDFRENRTETETAGMNTNLASFLIGTFPAMVPIPFPDYSATKDQFRSVVTTKVINTFALLEETIAHDAGASVSTYNLAWDAVTGEPLVTMTTDEYHDKYYTMNYPAHWNYSGMGPASQNIGLNGECTHTGNGWYTLPGITVPAKYFHLGDKVFLNSVTDFVGWIDAIAGSQVHIIDENGDNIAATGEFEIIRSGHRNLQSAGIMNVTMMKNPLTDASDADLVALPSNFLEFNDTGDKWDDYRIINAGAVDYSDDWTVGCECGNDYTSSDTLNPYFINQKGVWRTRSSRTYLTGRNHQDTITPRRQGFFLAFSPMYKVSGGNWTKDFTNWTYVAEVTRYSPYGFELENVDALDRYSAAQYGYNNMLPMAVGANSQYREMGFDGFEDHGFGACAEDLHFSFAEGTTSGTTQVSETESHTGKHSFKLAAGAGVTLSKVIDCVNP